MPPDAPAGEEYGVVWAQPESTPTTTGVSVVNRVGVRIYLTVTPDSSSLLDHALLWLAVAGIVFLFVGIVLVARQRMASRRA